MRKLLTHSRGVISIRCSTSGFHSSHQSQATSKICLLLPTLPPHLLPSWLCLLTLLSLCYSDPWPLVQWILAVLTGLNSLRTLTLLTLPPLQNFFFPWSLRHHTLLDFLFAACLLPKCFGITAFLCCSLTNSFAQGFSPKPDSLLFLRVIQHNSHQNPIQVDNWIATYNEFRPLPHITYQHNSHWSKT